MAFPGSATMKLKKKINKKNKEKRKKQVECTEYLHSIHAIIWARCRAISRHNNDPCRNVIRSIARRLGRKHDKDKC